MKFLASCYMALGFVCAHAFQIEPWLGEFLQFYAEPSFMYRHYPSVNRGYNPSSYSSNDRFTNFDVRVAFLPDWEAELGVEFADTSKQCLGTQSAGAQVRYRWLDDIASPALVTLTSALNVRWASKRSLEDVSCPYHAEWNFELDTSIGKEFCPNDNWIFRPYAFLGIGQAIKGSPWLRGFLVFDTIYKKHHEFKLFADGYFGFGNQRFVNINDFDGYASIFHQSIDAGAAYYYHINNIWGSISLYYTYRVFAKAYPSHANSFMVMYQFPFSMF